MSAAAWAGPPADEAACRADTARTDARCSTQVAALRDCGYAVHIVDAPAAGRYLVTRWGRSVELVDLDAVAAFLARVAPKARL